VRLRGPGAIAPVKTGHFRPCGPANRDVLQRKLMRRYLGSAEFLRMRAEHEPKAFAAGHFFQSSEACRRLSSPQRERYMPEGISSTPAPRPPAPSVFRPPQVRFSEAALLGYVVDVLFPSLIPQYR